MTKTWRKPRLCLKCRKVHFRPEEAKINARGDAYCTWCGGLAPKLKAADRIQGKDILSARLSQEDCRFIVSTRPDPDNLIVLPSNKIVTFASKGEYIACCSQLRQRCSQ